MCAQRVPPSHTMQLGACAVTGIDLDQRNVDLAEAVLHAATRTMLLDRRSDASPLKSVHQGWSGQPGEDCIHPQPAINVTLVVPGHAQGFTPRATESHRDSRNGVSREARELCLLLRGGPLYH